MWLWCKRLLAPYSNQEGIKVFTTHKEVFNGELGGPLTGWLKGVRKKDWLGILWWVGRAGWGSLLTDRGRSEA